MLTLSILIVLIVSVNGAVLPSHRLAGGSSIGIVAAPYNAVVLLDITGSGLFTQGCGGVIVTTAAILTSAQCATYSAFRVRIRVGSSWHNNGGQIFQAKSLLRHELYQPPSSDHDVGIIFIDGDIVLSVSARMITLPEQDVSIPDGTECLIFGWGNEEIGGQKPDSLHRAVVPIVNHDVCKAAYSAFLPVTSNMICAGYYGVGGVGPCEGDIGGPLVYNGILYGISSWSLGCADANFPSVYTNVSTYSFWIHKHLY